MEVLGPTIKQGRSEDTWMVPHCTETHKVTSNIFMASFEGKGIWASNICLSNVSFCGLPWGGDKWEAGGKKEKRARFVLFMSLSKNTLPTLEGIFYIRFCINISCLHLSSTQDEIRWRGKLRQIKRFQNTLFIIVGAKIRIQPCHLFFIAFLLNSNQKLSTFLLNIVTVIMRFDISNCFRWRLGKIIKQLN